jgi:hypothetical protein
VVVKSMASTLLSQLAGRTSDFLSHTGVSQARLCRYLNIGDSSLSEFLHGTKGLAPETLIKLCQTLSMSHREVATKLTEPARSSKILNLQESTAGQPAQMRFDLKDDGAWVPGLSGTDPNDAGNTIVDPTDDTLDSLRRARAIHRKAIRAINEYLVQATVNRQGSTPVPADAPKFSRS